MAASTQTGTQRIRYFDRQLLTARDLQDDAAYESRMRGLHVRALHNTWGIALGFGVRVDAETGKVLVGPGIAYDCLGREIVSAHTIAIDPPLSDEVGATWFDLVISYRDLEAFREARGAGEGCLGGLRPEEERPAWRWHRAEPVDDGPPPLADAVRLGEELPLARFQLTGEGALSAPDLSLRRHARGLVRPHLAGGQVEGHLLLDRAEMVWTLEVDTSAGGFSQPPHYFACLASHPLLDDPETHPASLRSIQGPFVSVRAPGRDRFLLDVRFGAQGRGATSAPAFPSSGSLPVSVNWLGIEPVLGCTPPFEPLRALFLSGFQFVLFNPIVLDTIATRFIDSIIMRTET